MPAAKTIISKDVLGQLLDKEKLKYCYECGICTSSCSMSELLGKTYSPRALLENIILMPDKILNSEQLWLCAWCYRCQRRCNQALRLPEIFLALRVLAAENGLTQPFDKALQLIAESVPLPLVTLHVCFHPERAGLDQKQALGKLEKMYEAFLRTEKAKRAQAVFEEKIAVIGSGPAGLAVAYELSRRGYGVTVFEALHEAGGMLRKCIPTCRLPREILEKELQVLKDLGVEIKTDTTIGQELSFAGLWREGYKAIFVGAGAHRNQKLGIEGADLKGVSHALELLWKANSCEKMDIGKNVVVIGGGNVAIDAARASLRMGAEKVTVLYRRSREEMPAIPWEVREAEAEGVAIEFLVSPKKILGKSGNVSGVECVRMQLGEVDETGRRAVTPVDGSEFQRDADMVILAIGEAPDLEFLPKEVELNEDGMLYVNPLTLETTLQGVFGGGDAATGPATVIEAVTAGKLAAESIDNYLRHKGA